MNYYRWYEKDGTCKVICMRCFLTVGVARGLMDLKRLEALHECSRVTVRNNMLVIPASQRTRRQLLASPLARVRDLVRLTEHQSLRMLAACLGIVLLLYVFPTAIELAASQHLTAWFAIILPGDILGCLCLVVLFRMYRTGIALYLLLTVCESYLYKSNLVPESLLVWLVDAVPTIVVAAVVLRFWRKAAGPVLA